MVGSGLSTNWGRAWVAPGTTLMWLPVLNITKRHEALSSHQNEGHLKKNRKEKKPFYRFFVDFPSCTQLISPSPPTCPLSLPPPFHPTEEKNLVVESLVGHSLSHTRSFCPQLFFFFACKCLRPLASATLSILEPLWESSRIACFCPVS